MKTVTIHEAKTHLPRLVKAAERGETVIIARGKEPVAELRSFRKPARKRPIGDYEGRIRISSDFDAPLDDFAGYR